MPREAHLFDEAGGNVVRGYILLKQQGGNIPPMWIERAQESRRNRHKEVTEALQNGSLAEITTVEAWDLAYRKECFYRGIRCLLELERNGRSSI
jgi:hypothetical protein